METPVPGSWLYPELAQHVACQTYLLKEEMFWLVFLLELLENDGGGSVHLQVVPCLLLIKRTHRLFLDGFHLVDSAACGSTAQPELLLGSAFLPTSVKSRLDMKAKVHSLKAC